LTQIAKDSNAKSFFCQNSEELASVYDEIASLEPSPIRSEQYLDKKEWFIYPLALAILLLALLIFKEEERE